MRIIFINLLIYFYSVIVYVAPTVLRKIRISVSDGRKSCGRLIKGTVPLCDRRGRKTQKSAVGIRSPVQNLNLNPYKRRKKET
jgi:hypothetical protein